MRSCITTEPSGSLLVFLIVKKLPGMIGKLDYDRNTEQFHCEKRACKNFFSSELNHILLLKIQKVSNIS
jgi:hypothetical protein